MYMKQVGVLSHIVDVAYVTLVIIFLCFQQVSLRCETCTNSFRILWKWVHSARSW